jgi:undecaprenyl-diphosphatase
VNSAEATRLRLGVSAAAIVLVIGLAFVVTRDNWVTRADADIVRAFADHRGPALTHAAEVLTYLGNVIVLGVLTIGLGLVLRFGPADVRWPFLPALALAAAAIIDPLAKLAVGRPRPPAELAALIEKATGYPSGHSAQSAAAWIAMAFVLGVATRHRRRWVIGGVVVAALVGITRIVLGVHSPTDVLGGWSLGLACTLLLVELRERMTRGRAEAVADDRETAPSRSVPANDPAPRTTKAPR